MFMVTQMNCHRVYSAHHCAANVLPVHLHFQKTSIVNFKTKKMQTYNNSEKGRLLALGSKVYVYGCNLYPESTHQLIITEPHCVRSADRCLIGSCS